MNACSWGMNNFDEMRCNEIECNGIDEDEYDDNGDNCCDYDDDDDGNDSDDDDNSDGNDYI